jgi:anaerobic magnesium-protoporphyrin IX monomethyl ester cyclase
MTQIMLINPNLKNTKYVSKVNAFILPPTSLILIGTYLKEKKYSVSIFDGHIHCEVIEDFLDKIASTKPNIIGMTVSVGQYEFVKKLGVLIKQKFPNIIIIVGGTDLANKSDTIAKTPFDYVILGDGEEVCLQLVNSITNKKQPPLIKGLISKSENKSFNKCFQAHLSDIDKYPNPDYSLINMKEYKSGLIYGKTQQSIPIITSRGCPYKCSFCVYSLSPKKYVTKSAKRVFNEIKSYIKSGFNDFWFCDDNFMNDKKRVEEICKLIIKSNIKITWHCMARVNDIREELVSLMKQAGCWQIAFGIESGSQEILNSVHKGITLKQISEAIKTVNASNIITKGLFILGLPKETKKTINKTISFAKKLKLDMAIFFLLSIEEGTQISLDYPMYGHISTSDSVILTHGNNIFVPKGLTKKYLIRKQKEAILRFYFRPNYLIRQLRKRSLKEIIHYTKAFFKVIRI